jgi:glycosyltransferase involved in cell wall biosynthesis
LLFGQLPSALKFCMHQQGASHFSWQDSGLDQPRPVLICFSHLRWAFVFQRPQHLMTRAARTHSVYFFEEPLFEASVVPRLDHQQDATGVTIVTPVLPDALSSEEVLSAQRDLLNGLLLPFGSRKLVAWYYTPIALAFSAHLSPDICVYDNMDELSAFRRPPPRLLELEQELFQRADVVFTGGQSLYEAKRGKHPNIHAFPSSIDVAHFGLARHGSADPPDQIGTPRPRLGFFGVVDERMDLSLVDQMAAKRPQWHFMMLGPTAKIDPASLPQRANVHWLGVKPYNELPQYLSGWDVGIMPFAINDSTRFISPTKTPEFLAAGVPVVSTPIADVIRPYGHHGLVDIADNADEFIAKAELLLIRSKSAWLERVDQYLSGMSWDKTWQGMHDLMREPPHVVQCLSAWLAQGEAIRV